MSEPRVHSYRIREFAKLAGVTVRALQHYDRLGLLTPPRQAGARVYSESDLQALVQIVALKSVGVPLKKIGLLRSHGPTALVETLGAQRRALERKQPAIDRVIFAVRRIEAVLNSGEEADPAVLRPLMDALRNGEAEQTPAEPAGRQMPGWDRLKPEWEALLASLEAAAPADPNDPALQDLARRWETLMALSTDGAPYTRDLAHHVGVLRDSATDPRIPGAAPFEKIGTALATRVAPNGTGGPVTP